MKKSTVFLICILIVFGFYALSGIVLSSNFVPEAFEALKLPKGFPSVRGLVFIWGFLSLLWGISAGFVFSVNIKKRGKRNMAINTLFLIGAIFSWHFLVFVRCMPLGALAMSIAMLLLALVVLFMYLLVHRNGGYLFLPVVVWLVYTLYLSISLFVLNR